MRYLYFFLISILFLLSEVFALPSFPGAEGYGADNPGARGKPVFKVTNLLALNVTGSLPWCVNQANSAGGGYIVFTISGTIPANISVSDNITIAGQTSPGGIALDGTNTNGGYTIRITGKNIIVRHIRSRGSAFNGDGFQLSTAEDVILDHCSSSWWCDGGIDIVTSKNITIQWCTLGDAAKCHDEGFHNLTNLVRTNCGNISIHHTLYYSGRQRNPLVTQGFIPGANFDFRNNVIFNYHKYDSRFDGDVYEVNVVGNYWKPGEQGDCDGSSGSRPVVTGGDGVSLYIYNNRHIAYGTCIAALRPYDTYDEWSIAGTGQNQFGPIPGSFNKLDSPTSTPSVTTHPVDEAYDLVLDNFGAFPRDNTDKRIEQGVRSGNGTTRDTRANDNNTYSGTAPADADDDGMADPWEQANGGDLDPNGHDLHSTYDNIEVYINELADNLVGDVPIITPNSSMLNNGKTLLSIVTGNPFKGSVTLNYDLKEKTRVTLGIYDIKGKHIKSLIFSKAVIGNHNILWDCKDQNGLQVQNGVYFARMIAGNKNFTQKLVLMR